MNSSMNVIYFDFMLIAQNNFEEIEKTKQVKTKKHYRHKGINITHHIKAQTLFNLRRGSLLNAFARVVNKSRISLCCDDDFFKHILRANTRKEIKAQKATAHDTPHNKGTSGTFMLVPSSHFTRYDCAGPRLDPA